MRDRELGRQKVGHITRPGPVQLGIPSGMLPQLCAVSSSVGWRWDSPTSSTAAPSAAELMRRHRPTNHHTASYVRPCQSCGAARSPLRGLTDSHTVWIGAVMPLDARYSSTAMRQPP